MRLIEAGYIGASAATPKTAFSIRLLRFHDLMWKHTSVGFQPFSEALDEYLNAANPMIICGQSRIVGPFLPHYGEYCFKKLEKVWLTVLLCCQFTSLGNGDVRFQQQWMLIVTFGDLNKTYQFGLCIWVLLSNLLIIARVALGRTTLTKGKKSLILWFALTETSNTAATSKQVLNRPSFLTALLPYFFPQLV